MSEAVAALALDTHRERDWFLGRTSRRIVAELAETVLPEEGRTRAIIAYIVEYVDSFVPHMPRLFRSLFPLGLLLIQWGSVATLMALKPFTLLGSKVRERYLHRWAESPFAMFRALAQGIRGLILSGYYSLPSVYREIGYEPDAYLKTCRERRAALVAEHGEGDSHTRSMLFEDIGRAARA